jgi:23S rRNA pseudouridine1911/1915/1917 synthase
MEKLFKVLPEDNKKRLDKFLSENLPEHSRSYVQKLIEDGLVFVGGKIKIKKYSLKEGEKIKVLLKEPEVVTLESDDSIKFEIIFENKDLAVISKPAGLVVHPSDTHKKGTLVNGLLAKWPEIKSVGEDKMRPGIVHRLDKETSGLMVIAKTNEMFIWLKEQFKERKVTKKYLVLVFGSLKEKKGEISAPIGRVGMKQVTLKRGRAYKKITKTREAKTEYKVLEELGGYSLVEVSPKTGRTHQIRVHFAHIGHPVVGDKKYASKKMTEKKPLKRHFLHAFELDFFMKNGKKVHFEVGIPNDLKKVLKGLEK